MALKKGPFPSVRGTSWIDARLDAVASNAFGFWSFMIVSGLAALVWVAFVGTAMLRSAPTPPQRASALPPLFSPTSPSSAALSTSPSQALDSGRLPGSQPTPFASDAPGDAFSTATPALGEPPQPSARKAAGKDDAAQAGAAPKPVAARAQPPAKPVTITIRTFHPPVISSFYKDMVADKMKEQGIDARLEAKVRKGLQLTKEDLASIPKPVMEKINSQVVAYGQPPLYTDTTTTTMASAAH